MDNYEVKQRERLRRVKLTIYKTLRSRGIPRTSIPKAAGKYEELYTYSEEIRKQHQKLLKALGPEPYPLAVSLPDVYQQHNFICACLSTIVAPPPQYEPPTIPVPLPMLVTFATTEAIKYEMQELIYSKLLELMHDPPPVDSATPTTLPTNLLPEILERLTSLEQKITKLEESLNAG